MWIWHAALQMESYFKLCYKCLKAILICQCLCILKTFKICTFPLTLNFMLKSLFPMAPIKVKKYAKKFFYLWVWFILNLQYQTLILTVFGWNKKELKLINILKVKCSSSFHFLLSESTSSIIYLIIFVDLFLKK